jgi:TRAP-type transport system periplasmic protein
MQRSGLSRWRFPAVLLAVTTLTAACSDPARDRAGGHAADQVRVLTFAQEGGGAPGTALLSWAEQVRSLSGGSLRVEFRNAWRMGEPDFEVRTVGDVRDDKVDLAWVGARVFDRVGVTSFQALLAPMLVDSQTLQEEVFTAGLPNRMLEDLEPSGVVGLGVLPGPMRKVMGVSKPFLSPADFAGTVIGMQDSDLTSRTLTAWGATPKPVPSSAKLTGLDGYEQQLGSIMGNNYGSGAKYVTANLNLWPRPLVMIASPRLFDDLSADQQRALKTAAARSWRAVQSAARSEDESSATTLCADGMNLAVAPAADLALLRAAVDPIYRGLDNDPQTHAWLEQIRALKASLAGGPDTASCPEQPIDARRSPIPDGTYEMTIRTGEAVRGCPPNTESTDRPTTFRLTLLQGTVRVFSLTGPGGSPELGWRGTYQVFRDRVDFHEDDTGIVLSTTWTMVGDRLTLDDLQGGNCGDANVWTLHPWIKVD